MTEIVFQKYAPKYKKALENSDLAQSTVDKKKIAINEFIRYCQEQDLLIETENFHESLDKIKDFFHQTTAHQPKISAIRGFIEYIGKQEDTRTQDHLRNLKGRIVLSDFKDVENKGSDSGISVDQIRGKLLTEDEIKAAKEEGSEQADLLIDLMLDSAARPGEVVAMRPEDLFYDEAEQSYAFDINETFLTSNGTFQDFPKHKSFRTVKLSEDVHQRLQDRIERLGVEENGYVFGSYRSDVYRRLKKAFTKAEVRMDDGSTEVTPHFLRHTACTWIANNDDNSIKKVRDYMGHKNIDTTEKYLHLDPSKVVGVELV